VDGRGNMEREIRRFLKSHADPAIVKKYCIYFKEGYDPYGVAFDTLGPKINEWFGICREKLDRKQLLALCESLLKAGKFEEVSVALGFMERLRDEYNKTMFNTVGKWFEKYIINWGHCDAACHTIVYSFLADKVVDFRDLLAWADSPHRWKRRAAAVTMVKDFYKGGAANVTQALQVSRKLILDPERVVQQGTGWLLREAWKKSPQKVEDFLLKWKDQAPRLIIQYATERIDKEKRKRFRRSQK
jgi:3-methyladenine DNA glycosylase AlkD